MERLAPRSTSLRKALAIVTGIAAVAAMLAAAPRRARADYPDRIIHLIVPYPPGGPNDVIARLLGQKLLEAWGQQVVIDNRPGGSGNIAIEATARAAPDGYTLVLPAMAYAVNPSLFAKVGYRFDELAAVSIITTGPVVLVVHPAFPAGSVADLIALARARPGTLDYGSGGNGSSLHLAAEVFQQLAGVKLQHIPYKGTNDLISDLLAGRVPISFISPLIAKPLVNDGRLRALAVSSTQRAPGWPDTPTIAEAGVPGYEMAAWYAILAPRATPPGIIGKLSHAIAAAVTAPDVRAKLADLGNEAVGSSPAEAERFIAAEAVRWEQVLRAANVKIE